MTKKTLITGAAGFIGSHLVDHLLEQKFSPAKLRLVIAPWDDLGNLSHLKPSVLQKLEIIKADIRNKEAMRAATKGVDTIYHLAARIDFEGKTFNDYKDVNVDATSYLLNGVEKDNFKKFVFFSSIGVFGLPAGIGDILGWDETHPKTYTNYYGQSKWEGEKLVMAAHDKFKIPYAIIRPASVYGPREKGPTLALYRAINHHQFVMIGNGDNKMHYVYVNDLVTGTVQAAQSRASASDYILAGDRPIPFKEIVKDVAASINQTVPSFYLPTNLALAAAYGMDLVGKVLHKQMPLFPSRVRTMTTTYYYSIAKARREIGYDPQVTFKKGSKMTGAWYLQNNWLTWPILSFLSSSWHTILRPTSRRAWTRLKK